MSTFSLPEEHGAKVIMEIVAGTVERLIELSGGKNVSVEFTEKVWEGGEKNSLEVKWEEE